MQRFEMVEGSASKFWEISREGAVYTVRFGRIGTNGQTQSKTAASEAKAQAEVDKLIREKTGKGYREVAVAAGAALASVAPKAPRSAPAVAAAAPGGSAGSGSSSTSSSPSTSSSSSSSSSAAPSSADVVAAGQADTAPAVAPGEARTPADMPMPSGVFQFANKPSWREALPAQRGFPARYEPLTTQLMALRLTVLREFDRRSYQRLVKDSGMEALAAEYPLETLLSSPFLAVREPARWVAALRLSGGLYRYDVGSAFDSLVELCVSLHGPQFAAEVYIDAAAHFDGVSMTTWYYQQDHGIGPLNSALASCSDDDYASALAAARARADLNGGQRFARGLVFNSEPDFVAEALAEMEASNAYCFRSASKLAGVRLSLDQGAKLVKAPAFRGHLAALRLALNLARVHGQAAVPLVATLYDAQNESSSRTRIAEVLRAFDSGAAFAELVERIEQKEVRPLADDFARAWPFAAMQAVAQALARSRNRGTESWLARMLSAHAELIEPLRCSLDGAALALVERLLDRRAELVDAATDELPPVLRDPPWLKPVPKKTALAPLPEAPLPAPTMRWPEGLRERWLPRLRDEGDEQPAYRSLQSWQHEALGRLSIPAHLYAPLLSGELRDLTPHREEIAAFRLNSKARSRGAGPRHLYLLADLPAPLRLLLWNALPDFESVYGLDDLVVLCSLIAHHETAAVPGLRDFLSHHLEYALCAALPVADAAIAPFAAAGLAGKKARPHAGAWLRQHAELATAALLQQAGSGTRKLVDQAEAALRWLLANVERERLDAGAALFGEAGATRLAAILSVDPLAVLPQKPRAMPAFFLPGGFSRPRLREGGAVPVAALGALGTMLQVSLLDEPYAGLDQVRAACTPESLDAFAWDLFQAWLQSGAPSKEAWAYHALGHLGGDQSVRELTPLIRQWPGEAQHARAVTGLDILAAIGSDLALMNLNGIAEKVKFKGLQERARQKIDAVAEARGLTAEELADRLVPDLDLDEQGTLQLDFGTRRFTVGFDEQLRPFVRDAEGARLKDLPKPVKSDDAELAKAAGERWKLLKKDAKAIASNQLQRLEALMCSGRTLPAGVFERFFARHPLLRHLAARLLWAVRDADGRLRAFRIAEDLSYADRNDEPFDLPAEAEVCVPHVLSLDAEDLAGFGQVFADYEILQPFQQLGREVLAMDEGELQKSESERFKGKRVAIGSVYGLQHRGWRAGGAQDGGWIGWFEKPLPGGLEAQIQLEPGTVVGEIHYEPKQTLGVLSLQLAGTWDERGKRRFADLSPVVRSELLRDLDRLTPLLE